ncbi:hypothetical protein PR048_001823 [Dryococelus australis]|uniref:Uncharacterized protein n=1 Tax=Dryococelus australis TaxID=614101 RepID=A0ABQ9IIE4_9NEOP|nr:hypothetical protein PR048_001823 [Dryococelus australis]
MGERGKLQIPEKTRQPAASSTTIPTYKNPGMAPPRIEPGSHGWEAGSLTTRPPRTPHAVSMERRRKEGAGETRDPRENPPTNGIVRQDSHLRKSGDPTGD